MALFIPNPAANEEAKQEVEPDMKRRADAVEEAASGLAPVDTGELASSGEVQELGDGGFRVAFTAPYAGYVEFGTWKDPAQPFIRPATAAARE